MTALRYFLVTPKSLALRDITIANWTLLDAIGRAWETQQAPAQSLNELLPSLDVWLYVPLTEIRHVVHILPTLDWRGGDLGVRLQYCVTDFDRLKADYLLKREASIVASQQASRVMASRWKCGPSRSPTILGVNCPCNSVFKRSRSIQPQNTVPPKASPDHSPSRWCPAAKQKSLRGPDSNRRNLRATRLC